MKFSELVDIIASFHLVGNKSNLCYYVLPELADIIQEYATSELDFEKDLLNEAAHMVESVPLHELAQDVVTSNNPLAQRWLHQSFAIANAYFQTYFITRGGQVSAKSCWNRIFLPFLHHITSYCCRPVCFWRIPRQDECICGDELLQHYVPISDAIVLI